MSTNKSTLLDDVRRVMRVQHYSIHSERAYCDWIKQFVKFHRLTDRSALSSDSEKKIEDFLTYLAIERQVAVSTQNQAMNALVFLYKKVLAEPLDKPIDAVRATKNRRIPVVLSQDEVRDVITLLDGVPQLVVKLFYGSGLRITEAVRIRVQDIDFEYKQVTDRSGKGNKGSLRNNFPFWALKRSSGKARKRRNMPIFQVFATQSVEMDRRSKGEVIFE